MRARKPFANKGRFLIIVRPKVAVSHINVKLTVAKDGGLQAEEPELKCPETGREWFTK